MIATRSELSCPNTLNCVGIQLEIFGFIKLDGLKTSSPASPQSNPMFKSRLEIAALDSIGNIRIQEQIAVLTEILRREDLLCLFYGIAEPR